MPLPLTPELLEMGLTRIGTFVGQFKNLDTEAKKLLVRFIMNAADSGDANRFVKTRLGYLEAHDHEIDRPEPQRVQSRVVTGEFDERPGSGGGGQGRSAR